MQQQYKSLTQEQLRNLYSTTGAILLIDIPDGLEFGIDNILWKIGHKFKGIKFIPFGCHIISYTQKDQNNMFKLNKFIYFDQSKGLQTQYVVLKWSFKYSMFLELRGAQAQGYREGVKNFHFDSYLGPYPETNLQFWKQNANFISRRVLQKLDPIEKIYKFQEQYEKIKQQKQEEVRIDVDQEEQIEQIPEEEIQEPDQQEEMKPQQKDRMGNALSQPPQKYNKKQTNMTKKFQALSDTIYYSEIPRLLSNDPQHISRVNLNKTEILIEVVSKEWMENNRDRTHTKDLNSNILGILGEIQYSFIYFLIGEDQQSLQQWKKLVNLLVFSEDIFESMQILQLKREEMSKGNKSIQIMIDSFQQMALEFIVVLYNQIKQFPADFFIDELSKNSFMQTCLQRLNEYEDQQEGVISKKVKKRLKKLFKLLSTKFNYESKPQEHNNYDEGAPAIVQSTQRYF